MHDTNLKPSFLEKLSGWPTFWHGFYYAPNITEHYQTISNIIKMFKIFKNSCMVYFIHFILKKKSKKVEKL